jgi:hypothetical protein
MVPVKCTLHWSLNPSLRVHFNNIWPCIYASSKWSLHVTFLTNICVPFSPMHTSCTVHLILIVIHTDSIYGRVQIMKLIMQTFPHSSVISSIVDLKIPVNTLFPSTLPFLTMAELQTRTKTHKSKL